MQAQTLQRRFAEAERQWGLIDSLVSQHGLPDRAAEALFDVLLGLRVTRPSYVKRTEVEERTASRDLAQLVQLDLLQPHGQTRARYYTAGAPLIEQMRSIRSRREPLIDPYPGLVAEIRAAASKVGRSL